jgi:hypothetical protein
MLYRKQLVLRRKEPPRGQLPFAAGCAFHRANNGAEAENRTTSEDKIRSCVALGWQVAPPMLLTPEQETARRRIMAEEQISKILRRPPLAC